MKKRSIRKLLAGILTAVMTLGSMVPAIADGEFVYEDDTVRIAKYDGITYAAVLEEVTDEEVENTIAEILDSYAEYEKLTEGTAKEGDTVNIDYVGTIAASDVKTDEIAEEDAEAAEEETEAAEEETEAAEEETEAAEEETEAAEEDAEAAEEETEAAEEDVEAADEDTEAAEEETEAAEEDAEAVAEEDTEEAAADDRVAFDGGTAEGAELTLGSGSYIPGFEEGVVGMKVGETKDVAVTFPDDYYDELAGVDAIFTITLNYINGEEIIPELTDEWVKENEAVDTVEEFREQTRKDLEEDAQDVYNNEIQSEVLTKLFDASEVLVYDEAAVERNVNSTRQMYEMYAQMYGMTYEDFLSASGMDEETMISELEVEARESQKQVIILNKIAELEGLSVSDEDFEAYLVDMAAQYGYGNTDDEADDFDYDEDEEFDEEDGDILPEEGEDVYDLDELTEEENAAEEAGEDDTAEADTEEAGKDDAAETDDTGADEAADTKADEADADEAADDASESEETADAADEIEDIELEETDEEATDPVEGFLNDYMSYYGYDSVDTLRMEIRNSYNANTAAAWVVEHAVYEESNEEEMAPVKEETVEVAEAAEADGTEKTDAAGTEETAEDEAEEEKTAGTEETEADTDDAAQDAAGQTTDADSEETTEADAAE